jgi:hypothetical protein
MFISLFIVHNSFCVLWQNWVVVKTDMAHALEYVLSGPLQKKKKTKTNLLTLSLEYSNWLVIYDPCTS